MCEMKIKTRCISGLFVRGRFEMRKKVARFVCLFFCQFLLRVYWLPFPELLSSSTVHDFSALVLGKDKNENQ